ncbi:hypothetical protein MMC14_004624 [Varicellaria rhodocarpa]|nr:hypothetical protein [Varicellaria rhodocarpa]
MHFALPPRKSSHPPPYARTQRSSSLRRKRLKQGAILCVVALLLILGVPKIFSSAADRIPPGTPEVVVVTVIDPALGEQYVERIKENRQNYVSRHGYAAFFPNNTDYDVGSSPRSWSLIPALRHALTLYPHTTYFFSLSPHSIIMNPSLTLTSHIMDPQRLESLMLKDKPVVPPDSVIHTFSHLKGDNIDFVLTQDGEGLCQESFILRRGDWAKFFLDIWLDPLYRSYNFQKSEGHALEHIVQWHPTILTKLALIPQRHLNSYSVEIASRGGKEVMYQDGDFIVRAVGCEKDNNRHCDREMDPWYHRWKNELDTKT